MSIETATTDMLEKSACFLGLAEPTAAPPRPSSGPRVESLRCRVLDNLEVALREASHGATNIRAIGAGVEIAHEEIVHLIGNFGALFDGLIDALVISMLSPLQERGTEEDLVQRLTAFGRRVTDQYGLQQRNRSRTARPKTMKDAGRG